MDPMYFFLVSEVFLKQVLCNICARHKGFIVYNELHNSPLVLLAINKAPSLNHGNKTIPLPFSLERLSQNWSGCSLILLGLVIKFNLIYNIRTKCLFSGNMQGQTI